MRSNPLTPGAGSSVTDPLRRRWDAVVGGHAPEADKAGALAGVLARYDEPHRRYHTIDHVLDVLGTLDELLADPITEPVDADHRTALRAAAWLHDVVYDPTRHDNEARSAAYARDVLDDLGLDEAVVREVERLIELTAGHEVAEDDRAGMLMADADLAILGAAPDRYERYAAQIRAEYGHVPDEAYRQGRAAVLASFAGRPRLYRTMAAIERFEELARDNIAHEMASLAVSAAGGEQAPGAGRGGIATDRVR